MMERTDTPCRAALVTSAAMEVGLAVAKRLADDGATSVSRGPSTAMLGYERSTSA